jgi:uncharacterized protein
MQNILIGREEEQKTLLEALASDRSELVAVFGRRRVGKTYLIKHVYQEHLTFEITGLENSSNIKQLRYFVRQIATYDQSPVPVKSPSNWLEAFFMLAKFLDKQPKGKKIVVLLDELPWLAAHKSGIIMGLSWFWNSWAEWHRHNKVVVVICGSAVSWMEEKVVNDRGGLHNRITERVFVDPFTLSETEAYLHNRNVFFDRFQITQLYMALGGIPYYLNGIQADKSVAQNLHDLCFSKNGLLHDEFSKLYSVLYANADSHIKIIRILAEAQQGLTLSTIMEKGQFSESDNLLKVLEELEQSGFITDYYLFDKSNKDLIYRLTDAYSLFYLRFIEQNKGEGNWHDISQTQAAKDWADYAFKNIWIEHSTQIKKAMSIGGVYAPSSSFLQKTTRTTKGTQIELLFDRADKIINLFDIKFSNAELILSETDAEAIRQQMWIFKEKTKTKKRLMIVLLTTLGLEHNQYSLGLVEQILTMDALFL